MYLAAISSLYNFDAYEDGGKVYIVEAGATREPTATEWQAIKAEASALTAQQARRDQNAPILQQIETLDKRRIRPLAEGDAAYLAKLNKQIAALRAQLV